MIPCYNDIQPWLQVPLHCPDQPGVGLSVLAAGSPGPALPSHHHGDLALWLGQTTRSVCLHVVIKTRPDWPIVAIELNFLLPD